MEEELEEGTLIDSINIVVASYGFIFNLFPVYICLQNKTTGTMMNSIKISLSFCLVVYIIFSLLALKTYGDLIDPNIFKHIQEENNVQSAAIRVLFLLIFICHVPFVFFAGKDCLLAMIEEVRNRKLSKALS